MPRVLLALATSHRLRAVYPAGTGSDRLRLVACGVREWMTAGLYERPQGADDLLFMAFPQTASVGVEDQVVAAPAR